MNKKKRGKKTRDMGYKGLLQNTETFCKDEIIEKR